MIKIKIKNIRQKKKRSIIGLRVKILNLGKLFYAYLSHYSSTLDQEDYDIPFEILTYPENISEKYRVGTWYSFKARNERNGQVLEFSMSSSTTFYSWISKETFKNGHRRLFLAFS